jgi:stage V sporulation protein D (sporulation-specific penicillin-binding protein)
MSWRFKTTFFFFLAAFFLISLRLFYWQVVRANELSVLGENQYGKNVKVLPIRGEIKTSDNFPIAANKLSYLVFANPKEIENPEQITRLLSEELQVDPASISAQLMLDRFWVTIKRDVTSEEKARVEKLKLKGVGFEEHTVRFYPEASTAAKLLGFVGKKDDGASVGYFGLEGYYDRQLKGKEGRAMQIHDAFGRPILAKMDDRSTEVDGRNLTLHVDRAIQFMLDKEVKFGLEKYGAKSAMAAVMDPKTGRILAMSAFPSFDPRNYVEYKFEDYKNPFVSDMYEPGSTFKPLVMAAALNENLVKPDTECDICGAPVELGGYEIKTWNDEYRENITMADTIKHSDNTGMVFVAKKLGLDRMLSYFKKYGIGELTQIDLQGEVAPGVRPRSEWYPIDLATSSFGQGIPVTPIELLSAFSSIANNGVRMKPQVVASVETPEGEVIKIEPEIMSKPISEKTAKVMTEILVSAVDNGEAKWAKPKGYRIAGKTGTAQIPIAGHYDPTKTIASFIGFAPADDPKFVMLVVVDRPTTSIYGAETAAPIFFKAAKQLLDYYGINPTEPIETKK